MPGNYQGKRVARSHKVTMIVIAAVVAAAAAAAIFFLKYYGGAEKNPDAAHIGSGSGAGSASRPDVSTSQDPTEIPDEPKAPPYDFSQPVPEGEPVENSYFDDAAFVGDSRTDGFMLYSGIGTGENLAANGVSIFKLAERKSLTIDGEKYTPLEALALKQYGKVYIALGVNELGYNNDKGYYEKFCAAIDEVRRVQPNAVIYIQGLIPVNEAQYLAATGHDYLTNDHLRIYNQLMQQVAEEKKVAYVNVYEAFADENGSLPEGDSRDGVHLYKESCQRWLEYLRTHTVEFDTLYPDGPPPVEVPDPEPAGPDTSTADGSGQG